MNSKRNIYLKMKPLEEARRLFFKKFITLFSGTEEIVVSNSVGRVLSQPVFAKLSSPGYHASAMDGIAVNAQVTFGASETSPKTLVVGQDAFYVNTGHVLPKNCNAVIMIEHYHVVKEDTLQIEAPAFPWQNIRKVGEDIVATELLFPSNHKITPYCVGALISGGVFKVAVYKKPRVLIIPTGSEIIDWQKTPYMDGDFEGIAPGQVIESNSFVLGGLVQSVGARFSRFEKIIADDIDLIKHHVKNASSGEYDMVLIIGGSSAGSEDFSRRVIDDLGEIIVHGVTIMPGKPVILGAVKNIPVVGIPGYPVSAIVAFEQFVQPLLLKMIGQPDIERPKISVQSSRKISSKLGVEEFLRVKLGEVGEKIICSSLPRGAGSITSITEADGIIRIPKNVEGLNANEPLVAELLKTPSSIRNTIMAVGSHDNTLDILSDMLKIKGHINFSSSHVGSIGGLMALKNGACHLAGAHLLDPTDGSYNTSYINKYLKKINVVSVNLVLRDQGLIVQKGNPKKIRGIEDLGRDNIKFVNRQAGSGTRILLDFKLKELGMEPEKIVGYHNDEYTHMSVAVSVLSGSADAGLGIYAAAKALNLDFVPVITEQYDLIIGEPFYNSDNINLLIDTIHTKQFKKSVEQLGGYNTKLTGNIVYPV